MGKKTEPEEVARGLREAEAEWAGGKTTAQGIPKHGIREPTCDRWRHRYPDVPLPSVRAAVRRPAPHGAGA